MIRIACLVLALTLPLAATAQKHATPSFDVRENTSGAHGWSWESDHDIDGAAGGPAWSAKNMPLRQLLAQAYGLRTDQIVGLPDALRHKRFDVRLSPRNADLDQLHDLAADGHPITPQQLLLRKMLSENFGLQVHVEKRQRDVYELLPAENGTRLKQNLTCIVGPRTVSGLHPCGDYNLDDGRIVAAAANMDAFARFLGGYVGTVVVDKTGLRSTYDVNVMWRPATGDRGDKATALSAAMEKQLGLRLRPAVDAVPTLVVDHVELPPGMYQAENHGVN